MMFASESIASFTSNRSRDARCRAARATWSAHMATFVAKLRDLAPYAAIELLLPGGSVMALLLWLYRRQKNISVAATHEILSRRRPDEPMVPRTI